ncbi:PucR family transcriptional regulator [Conexibacter woesei]|uniref:Transcriptional regulator, CdaR n=1 Tax=Conexibacter woesei (strain DSM 14684 / CCUG 47730 / CIP 108061 / JCM 11494 / NBRC 100937 / ID131577) TaxID=469383 RepID=D3F6I4_CONWI|nr:PucR family transcriptional regulator [Conexibacter woesei]ADB50751.1 transcriptional regulator, CdaR [Conexibacter woesei DSM 14684]
MAVAAVLPAAPAGAMSVRSALELDVIRAGEPRVLAAPTQLDRPIRWVHVLDTPVVNGMLRGGELVLTTGAGAGRTSAEQGRYVDEVARSDAAALVLELGTVYRGETPRPLVDAANRARLPLVALQRPVRFVEVTEVVHGRLLGEQVATLERLEAMREGFMSLVLGGAATEDVLRHAARLLESAIVVHDGRGGLLSIDTGPLDEREALAAWERAAAGERLGGAVAPEPVEVRGVHRADVVALRPGRPFDAAERAAVRQVALTLGLEWLGRAALELSLRRRTRGNLLQSLLDGRLTPLDAERRLRVLGGGHALSFWPVAVVLRGLEGGASLLEELADGLSVEGVGRHGRPLLDVRDRRLLWAAPGPAAAFEPTAETLTRQLRRAAERHDIEPERLSVAIGQPVDGLAALREQFETTLLVAEAAAGEAPVPWRDARRASLAAIAFALKDDPRLVRFARSHLDRLERLPARRRDDLLRTLRAVLESGGHKSRAARELHLDRGALYKRMARLEEVLGVDLDDAQTRAALTLVLIWQAVSGPPRG